MQATEDKLKIIEDTCIIHPPKTGRGKWLAHPQCIAVNLFELIFAALTVGVGFENHVVPCLVVSRRLRVLWVLDVLTLLILLQRSGSNGRRSHRENENSHQKVVYHEHLRFIFFFIISVSLSL
jgi:hypothetical protein